MADIPIGAAIAKLRAEKQWSLRTLARRVKCHKTYVVKVEQEKNQPRMEQIQRFAEAFGLKHAWELVRFAETGERPQ